METSSVTSSFRFEGYKIDRIFYETIPEVKFLEAMGLEPTGWKSEIIIRQPAYFKIGKKYVGGIDMTITYPINVSPIEDSKLPAKEGDSNQNKNFVTFIIGIAGLFSVEEGRFEKNIEENLVKNQIPAILFPYLRSAITSISAHAGIGTILLPLLNIQELAKNANLNITEMD